MNLGRSEVLYMELNGGVGTDVLEGTVACALNVSERSLSLIPKMILLERDQKFLKGRI